MSENNDWLSRVRRLFSASSPADRADWPEWYAAYATAHRRKSPSGSQVLKEAKIIVIDAETTGLVPNTDRLLSLGGLRIAGRSILVREQFEAYLSTPTELEHREAVSIHGIIPNSQRYVYDTEEDLLARFLDYLGPDGVIVGHHIGFDVGIINRAMNAQGAGPLLNPVIDTGKLAQRIRPSGYWTPPREFSLDRLARQYNIPLSDRHTAMGDAFITAVLWLKLTARLEERLGREPVVSDLV